MILSTVLTEIEDSKAEMGIYDLRVIDKRILDPRLESLPLK